MPPPNPDRTAAIARGENFYFTGKPCKHGHVAKRRVDTGTCAVCASQASLRSMAKRPWHPARAAAKAAGEKHWTTGEPCQSGHAALRYVSNGVCVECDADKRRRWIAHRPGLEAKWARERRAKDPTGHRAASRKWAAANMDKVAAAVRRWRLANPERAREMDRIRVNRRRSRQAANGGSFTLADIESLHARQNGRCAVCPCTENLEIDHILPIFLGGSSEPSNLQLLCLPCNRSKGKKHPDRWREELALR